MSLQCVGGANSGRFYELGGRKHLETQNADFDKAFRGQISTQSIPVHVEVYTEAKISVAIVEHPLRKEDYLVFRFLKPHRATAAQAVENLFDKARAFDCLERLMGADYVQKLLKEQA